ncbi:MAG: 50S ribosomal protein L37e [Nitrososphaeraceae archaeon]
MTKGTTSMGKYTRKKVHIRCRRCGHNSFHKRGKECSKCGYPDPKIRKYNWIKRRVI